MINLNIMSTLAKITFFFVFFPYIVTYPLESDVQPNALLFALLYLCLIFYKKQGIIIPKYFFPIIFVIFYALCMFFIQTNSFMFGLRSCVGIFSFFIFLLFGYMTCKYISYKIIKYFIILWFIFTMMEAINFLFLDIYNPASLLIRRTTEVGFRGLSSLCVEPSYLGIMMFLFLLLNEVLYFFEKSTKKQYLFVACLSIMQMLFSLSILSIALLLIFLFAKGIQYMRLNILTILKLSAVTASVLSLILFVINAGVFFDLRIGWYLKLFSGESLDVLLDASVTDRMVHILVPFIGFFSLHGLIGYGPGNFGPDHVSEVLNNLGYQKDLISPILGHSILVGRVMSTYGSLIYEIGVVGSIIPLVLNFILLKYYLKYKLCILIFICMNLLFINAVPLAQPTMPFIFGIFLGYIKLKKHAEENVAFRLVI